MYQILCLGNTFQGFSASEVLENYNDRSLQLFKCVTNDHLCASKEIFPVRIQSQNRFKHYNTTKLSDSLGYDTHIVNVLVSNSVTGGQNKRYFFCELNFDQGNDCVSTACASTLKLPYKLQILMLIQIYLVAMLTETVELYLNLHKSSNVDYYFC